MAQQHGMSQIIQLYYRSESDVEFISNNVNWIKAAFRLILEPTPDAKMFGSLPITEFSEELFTRLAWRIKDSTFPFSLLSETSEDVNENAQQNRVNMNRQCLFIDQRRFGIDIKIWKRMKVQFQGSIEEVLAAIEAAKKTLVGAFATVLPSYIVQFGDTIMENMQAGFSYVQSVSETQLYAIVRDFSGRNPQFKPKSILSETDNSYTFTYEVVTKKIDQSSRNAVKVPRIDIKTAECQVQGALPIDKFLELRNELRQSYAKVRGYAL